MRFSHALPRASVLALLCVAPSCSDRGEAAALRSDSAAGTVELGLDGERGYRVELPAQVGVLAGSLAATGAAADSVVAVTTDARVCGDSAAVGPRADEGPLGNALVWVDGIGAGKPLPELRRQTFTIDGCRFSPPVLGVVTGTTINVFSDDPVPHDARFYREGDGNPVARVRTMDAGSVVPTEEIAARPGMVEARCANHPWERGYLAVFDHPYFAVTDATGAFSIEALPPGTYDVKAWHHGMSEAVTQRVVVRPGGAGELTMTLPVGRADPATAGATAGPRPSP